MFQLYSWNHYHKCGRESVNTWMLKTVRLCKPSRLWSVAILLVPRNKLCKDESVSRFSMTCENNNKMRNTNKETQHHDFIVNSLSFFENTFFCCRLIYQEPLNVIPGCDWSPAPACPDLWGVPGWQCYQFCCEVEKVSSAESFAPNPPPSSAYWRTCQAACGSVKQVHSSEWIEFQMLVLCS